MRASRIERNVEFRVLARVLQWLHLKEAVRSSIDHAVRIGMSRIYPEVVRALPHDPQARTQGLLYFDGLLYESVGATHQSFLRCIDPADGKVVRSITIEGDYAEGIATVGDRLFQLSWKSGIARIYQLPELVQVDEALYDGEGWGLAACPGGMVMSDGTCRLLFRDAEFRVTKELRVRSRGIPLRRINDIEYVDGRIYANVLGSSDLWVIAADSGKVVEIVDCSALAKSAGALDQHSVLNGIAYNRDDDTFFVTGKHWKWLYQVRLPAGPGTRGTSTAARQYAECNR